MIIQTNCVHLIRKGLNPTLSAGGGGVKSLKKSFLETDQYYISNEIIHIKYILIEKSFHKDAIV